MANEIFVKLKDQGTSFFDASQSKGVVRDQVASLKRTPKVIKAINGGALIEVSAADAKSKVKKEEPKKPAGLDELDKSKYSDLSVEQLKEQAAAKGVTLEGITKKAAIIAALDAFDAATPA